MLVFLSFPSLFNTSGGMDIFPINKGFAVFESKILAFNMCLGAYIRTWNSEEMKANIS